MARATTLAAAFAAVTLALLTACSTSGGDSAARATAPAERGAPAVETCLHVKSVRRLGQATDVSCKAAHEAQVYALIGLPAGITDPGVKAQVTNALPELTCPNVRAWAGYHGSVPVGLLHTWRFPTRSQIKSGARWAACVAILAPGPDHDTLRSTVGSLKGKLAGKDSPLPELGRCAPTHVNNASFTPSFCQPGSKQWIWLGAHPRPAGGYPGKEAVKRIANSACLALVRKHGQGRAFVYYPDSAAVWDRSSSDWSCWMPVAEVKS